MSDPSLDPFLSEYNESELRIASEFLSVWLPFLSTDLCLNCAHILSHRILALSPHLDGGKKVLNSQGNYSIKRPNNDDEVAEYCDYHTRSLGNGRDDSESNSLDFRKGVVNENWSSESPLPADASSIDAGDKFVSAELETRARKSWADMAQEDELEGERDNNEVENRRDTKGETSSGESSGVVTRKTELSRQQREYLRIKNVRRKKDFVCFQKVRGKLTNILDGLELHTGVFSAVEQKKIVNHVYELMEKGKNGELKERTFTAPRKWMKGKGRVTIQFGCCYNYATDKNGNPPGILKREEVDPLPSMFKVIIKRLIGWSVLPPSCVPDSCIVNIYDEGDCIPPHIDNHDFVRPFCTISFLSECNILFGTDLKIEGPGEFNGDFAIPLPVGSVLVLNGNGADVAKHCVPAVPSKRISITFRKMDKSKQPVYYIPEPDLQGLKPLTYDEEEGPSTTPSSAPPQVLRQGTRDGFKSKRKSSDEEGSSNPSSAPPQVVRQGTREGFGFARKSLVEPRYSARVRAPLKGPRSRLDLGRS